MNHQLLSERFAELSTPLVTDAALRLKVPARLRVLIASSHTFRQHLRKIDGAIEE